MIHVIICELKLDIKVVHNTREYLDQLKYFLKCTTLLHIIFSKIKFQSTFFNTILIIHSNKTREVNSISKKSKTNFKGIYLVVAHFSLTQLRMLIFSFLLIFKTWNNDRIITKYLLYVYKFHDLIKRSKVKNDGDI